MIKTCTKCKCTKDISLFHKNKASSDGYRTICKDCIAKYAKINAVTIAQYKKTWEHINQEHIKIQKKLYREQNKDSIAEGKKRWVENNPDKVKANYERALKRKQEIKYVSPWALNNPDKVSEIKKNYKHRRRTKEREGSVTTSELVEWLRYIPKVCEYCRTSCESTYHIDHIEPLSKEGKHELSNLAISCPTCNMTKSNKTLLVWFAQKAIEIKDKKP